MGDRTLSPSPGAYVEKRCNTLVLRGLHGMTGISVYRLEHAGAAPISTQHLCKSWLAAGRRIYCCSHLVVTCAHGLCIARKGDSRYVFKKYAYVRTYVQVYIKNISRARPGVQVHQLYQTTRINIAADICTRAGGGADLLEWGFQALHVPAFVTMVAYEHDP